MFFRLGILVAALAIGAHAQNAAVASRCYACHSSSAPAPQGGLLLDSTQAIRRGGNSGPAIQPGDPEHSLFAT